MTNKEIISNLEIGKAITNKQLLNTFEKKGLIYGYSEWCYLESCRISGSGTDFWYETFSNSNSPKCYDTKENLNSEELLNKYGNNLEFEYMGHTFSTKYISGCFQPYLIMTK